MIGHLDDAGGIEVSNLYQRATHVDTASRLGDGRVAFASNPPRLGMHGNAIADCDLLDVGAYPDHLTRSIHERHDRVGHTRILTGGGAAFVRQWMAYDLRHDHEPEQCPLCLREPMATRPHHDGQDASPLQQKSRRHRRGGTKSTMFASGEAFLIRDDMEKRGSVSMPAHRRKAVRLGGGCREGTPRKRS
jgi:hypothetical protein